MDFLRQLAPYRKAVVTFVIGVLQILALYVALAANGISAEDQVALISSVIVALGGTGAVYAVKNERKSL